MAYTPRIDPQTITNLRVIEKLYRENPEYFEETDYSLEIRQLIRDLVRNPSAPAESKGSELLPKDASIDLMKELQTTYSDLNSSKPHNQDTTQLMSYFRTKTNLLEKIQDLMLQADSNRQLSEFYGACLAFMEETLDAQQRAVFIEKLGKFAGQ